MIKKNKKYVLITGCAGFIGFHFANYLLSKKIPVIGIDMMNHYYDINLKLSRLKNLKNINNKNFIFFKFDIQNYKKLIHVFKKYEINKIVNLAAQAGVRDAIKKPKKYLNYNINGFLNILKVSEEYKINHLVYASTSSIYGLNKKLPFSESDKTDTQNQFYAVTKKTNELMAHVWSKTYKIPTTGLRFFTVYGPWGRPDMALFKFANSIVKNKEISVHNYGNHRRDFTYISDIVKGIYLALNKIPKGRVPNKIYNLGYGKSIKLNYYIFLLQKYLGKEAKKRNLPLQMGDIVNTSANISLAKKELGYRPKVNVEKGIKEFVNWYLNFYKQ